jgi:hypothetical protein
MARKMMRDVVVAMVLGVIWGLLLHARWWTIHIGWRRRLGHCTCPLTYSSTSSRL